ncbi:hypothetical protein CKO28_02450 [Rhodovibrio sodomensis]|uniref:Pilin accessory protein (PilO) n=1 Tax=Rhodovibrio sodomensis TaxID=1088 RepID=A0ABS1D9V5_9PROT|nr:type 4b pilus protein PilO2 [Rhodovibrio sodomensis]MBK1666902.1 hypothetical protein [Rhodovibrio sodomensis]
MARKQRTRTKQKAETASLGSPRALRLGRAKFAVGLFWQVAASHATIAREAKELAANPKVQADLFVACRAPSASFALAREDDGTKPGMIAAAAALIPAVDAANWLLAAELGGGYWVVAIRDRAVVPGTDLYFTDAEAAQATFADLLDQGGWNRVIAPEDWASDASSLDVVAALKSAKGPKLDRTSSARKLLTFGLVVVGGAALMMTGMWAWNSYQQAQQRAEYERIMEQRAKLKRKEVRPIPAPTPWVKQPHAGATIRACLDGMQVLPAEAPGYALVSITCEDGEVTHRWQRTNGTVSWFQHWLQSYGPYTSRFSVDASSVRVEIDIRDLAPRGKQKLADAQAVRFELADWAQSLQGESVQGAQVSASNDLDRFRPPTGEDAPKYLPANWASMDFEMVVGTPSIWASALQSIPGTVIDTVEFNAADSQFLVNGEIYVRD